jgi:hypothetical protein
MSFDSGTLHAALTAAVGDDAGLIDDLRQAFVESATRQIDLLSLSHSPDSWMKAAWRLKGLCASFGVGPMIALADEAEQAAPGDVRIVRRLRATLATISA